ncbi:hypothetical protein D9O36_14540 [Zobellia amurskyensis]|uniref:Uncharacterized protein n=1 Tax=Zobellia amurskyensis TaxID=248905 RepID=A0A7X2ZVB4_9FLAO|nr:hypothetical protein [Zobellia amurskyensis]MUH37067.1 hypothetical protein [Zobellia amurskyensis]
MEKTIELQKEFESLITQLSKLRTINELTNENSRNAKVTIETVSDLVSNLSKLKDDLIGNFEERKQSFDTSIEHFNQSILDIKERFETEVTEQHKTLKEINRKNGKDVAGVQNQLLKQVNSFENQLKVSTETAEIHFGELRKSTAKSIEENFNLVKDDIKRVSNSVELLEYDMSKKLEKSRRETKDLKKVIITVGVLLFVALIVLKFV